MPNTHSLDLEVGTNDYAYAADSASLSITGNMTLEAWLKLESQPSLDGARLIFNKWISNYAWDFMYRDDAGVKVFRFENATNDATYGNADFAYTLSTGVWTHVALVFTIATPIAELYINGVSQGTNAGTLKTVTRDGTDQLRLGTTGSNGWDGLIDEARIWSVARTASQIYNNYRKQLTGSETGLNAYWKLNNDYLDETANNNDLTASGSPVFSTDVPFTTDLNRGGQVLIY